MSCGREDGAVVLGEDVQLGRDVRCIILARFQRELEGRAHERGPKLSDQFLERIAFAAETMILEVTIEPARAPGPVHAFVGHGRIVAIRVPEAHERRHLDWVVSDAIERAIPAVADGCTRAAKKLSASSIPATGSSCGTAFA